ncbi:oxidation resistance protein 1 isoform 1-T1 [Menidia menidia]
MAQSVRRPDTLGAANLEPQRNKTRTSYFCNVKTRLGSKLPAGVSQPPQFAKPPWEAQPQGRMMQQAKASDQRQTQPIMSRPLNHIPHIRNPKLRQYYLQETSWDLNKTVVTKDHVDVTSDGLPGDTVFSVSSKFNSNSVPTADEGQVGHPPTNTCSQLNLFSALIPEKQLLSKGKKASTSEGSSQLDLDLDSGPEKKLQGTTGEEGFDPLNVQPPSPLPEAEYDKLLDVEAVPLPDGQLCLLALPPECCQGDGPESMQYLKLFCRYITDRKGVVSGILLVTPSKIFFDPCKTHPLVTEHGCEEYLLSCSTDNLASVSFYSDISHVHFNTSQMRRRDKNFFQKWKNTKIQTGSLPKQEGQSVPALVSAAPSDLPCLPLSLTGQVSEEEESDSRDMAEAERELVGSADSEESAGSLAVLSSAATFCCGGQEPAGKVKTDLLDTETSSVKSQMAAPVRSAAAGLGGLMFVRLRVQPSSGKKKGGGGLHIGPTKTLPKRDTWLALSQESSDELHAYLKRCRPDLCVLRGEDECDEEGFVLIEDEEEEDEEISQRHRGSGEDWELVLMEESKDKPALVADREPEGLKNVIESSQILEASHVRELCKELPPRTVGHTWQLAYSTSRHGASLKCLYRKLSATDSPLLIVIKDALDEVFGAFLSHSLRPSEAFYGTGETFLFMLHPRFKCFRWTGENSFFIKGDLDCFAIGGGSGHFGLWVDENLYLGRSSPCYTFNNCCLAETDDFRIMELEVWTFS